MSPSENFWASRRPRKRSPMSILALCCTIIRFLAVLVCLAVLTAKPQDPVKVDPKHHKVEFENDHVRVLRMHVGPKETSPMNEHPPSVAVWLTDARNKVTLGNGKTEERPHKAGSAGYRQAEKHTVEDLTDKGFEVIIVELKGKPTAKPAKAKPPVKKGGS